MRAEDVAAELRRMGFRLTAARWAVIRHLEGNTSHPTAQEIYEALRPEHPGLSLATVYHTLAVLEDIGAVAAMSGGPSGRRFDANPEPHVNLVCRVCGRVRDVAFDELAPLLSQAAGGADFEVKELVVEAHGVCRDCRAEVGSLPGGEGAPA
ncbi:MAG: transcriptional repressor [Clostridia bacterium]|nr:transcriptional repressor [Clostridia bacterium]